MEKIRVVFAISRMGVGGIQKSLLQVLACLDRERFAPRVFCLAGAGEWASELDRLGVPWDVLPGGYPHKKLLSRFTMQQLPKAVRYLRRQRPHVLHILQAKPVLFLVAAGKLAQTPVVLVHHRNDYRGGFWKDLSSRRRAMEKFFTRRADVVLAVSCSVADATSEALGIPRESIHVIPNGVGLVHPLGEAADCLPLPDVPEGAQVVVGVGRLVGQKRWGDLIGAAVRLKDSHPGLQWWIAGDDEVNGRERPRLEAAIRDGGLESRFHILGFRNDVPQLLARADMGVLCSEREGCPNAILEYMAAGLPIVGSDIAPIVELLEPEKEGLIVPLGDVDALAGAMARLVDEPGLAASLAEAAKEKGRRLDWPAVARSMENLYQAHLPTL